MWQRFTERARRIIFFAQEEAARLGENYVGTEHILLGLVRENDSVAARILDRLGVPLGRIRSDIERQVTRGHGNLGQDMQLTPRAKRVIDLAHEEARQLNNNYIGTEHLLLGLIREGDGLAARVLVKLGADLERARREIYSMQEGENQPSYAWDEASWSELQLTELATATLDLAREEAVRLGHSWVGTEHILIGLTREPDTAAARCLDRLRMPLQRLRDDVAARLQPCAAPWGPTPVTRHALRALDRAYEEARKLQSDVIGAEHLLRAILWEGDSAAAALLKEAGVSAEAITAKARELRAEPVGANEQRAEHFVSKARAEAERLGQPAISPELLLLGLIEEADSTATRILEASGLSRIGLSFELEQRIPARGPEGEAKARVATEPLFTPRLQEVLDRAREEAGFHRNPAIGTEHLLLGLVLAGESLGAGLLKDAGVSIERVRIAIPKVRPDGAADQTTTVDDSAPGDESGPRRSHGNTAAAAPGRMEQLAHSAASARPSREGRLQGARHAVMAARNLIHRDGRLTDLVSIHDLTPAQAKALLHLAQILKSTGEGDPLAHRELLPGKTLAMIFEKPSLRTRVTFETGMFQMGGHAISLQPAEIQLGKRETVADAARNLERWVDGIMARTFSHDHVIELAQNAGVPVINGLTDREHPCQALADFLTILENKGRTEGLKLAFIGDGNNVAHSLMLLGAKLGTHVVVAGPEGYEPEEEILQQAQEAAGATGARIEVMHDPSEAVRDADVIYTDVWASMGQEAEAEERARHFAPFQVNAELVRQARWDAIAMHDLPAHRGQEITDEVMDGPQSAIFDQAENRLHAQKAVLAVLLG